MSAKKTKYHPLCYRCEHRVRHIEDLANGSDRPHQPRVECGDTGKAVFCCYNYAPVSPVVVRPQDGEERPLFIGSAFAGRADGVRVLDAVKHLASLGKGELVAYCTPAGEERHGLKMEALAEAMYSQVDFRKDRTPYRKLDERSKRHYRMLAKAARKHLGVE